jgi:hypothetical protein
VTIAGAASGDPYPSTRVRPNGDRTSPRDRSSLAPALRGRLA